MSVGCTQKHLNWIWSIECHWAYIKGSQQPPFIPANGNHKETCKLIDCIRQNIIVMSRNWSFFLHENNDMISNKVFIDENLKEKQNSKENKPVVNSTYSWYSEFCMVVKSLWGISLILSIIRIRMGLDLTLAHLHTICNGIRNCKTFAF